MKKLIIGGIILFIVAVAGFSLAAYFYYLPEDTQVSEEADKNQPTEEKSEPDNELRECTLEAKICPDGSSVGRTGPNCEFTPCPDEPEEEGPTVEPKNTYSLFSDTNFTMQLSNAWGGDAGYESGSSIIFFYSPEDFSDENRNKAAYMTIYVGLAKNDETIDTRIDTQLSSLSNPTVLLDEKRQFGDYLGRVVELIVSSPGRPDRFRHVLSATTIANTPSGERMDYHIDVYSDDNYWSLHDEEARTAVFSFQPTPNIDSTQ